MNIQENHIEVRRSARYFTYGELGPKTKHVWFACHGYGMLASSLIKKFGVLDPSLHYIVAPEGLSRFYWNGFGGKPVASWMTSEDRLYEIKDYIAYLDQLYSHILSSINQPVMKTIFGFSQGTATITRWVANQQSKADNLVLWAGPLASDVEWDKAEAILRQMNLLFVYGTKDQFINEEQANKHLEAMKKHHLDFEVIQFDGEHRLDRDTIVEIAKRLHHK